MSAPIHRIVERLRGKDSPRKQKHKETLLDLTAIFLKAALPPRPRDTDSPRNENQYSIYLGNARLGILNTRHLFVRLVNGDGKTECEIHGTPIQINGFRRICAIIKPLSHRYFSQREEDRSTLLWTGSADDAGHKIRRAARLVALINENPQSYNPAFRNCNTILKSMLTVMELKAPSDPAGWTPGYGQYYGALVEKVRQDIAAQSGEHDSAAWLDHFLTENRVAGETLKERVKDFKFA
jgi:hypothetical protein